MYVYLFVNGVIKLIDERERAVVDFWQKGHLSRTTILNYLQWVRHFRAYCQRGKLVETEQLTAVGIHRFTRSYVGRRLKGRRVAESTRAVGRKALRAWACAQQSLGMALPPWCDKPTPPSLPPLLSKYCQYRKSHNGVSQATLVRDIATARSFLEQLRCRRKSVEQASLKDVDSFVQKLSTRVAKRTVADTCSSLRAFLRFLQMTGRVKSDVASGVIAPRLHSSERPPRTMPWKDVQRILRRISPSKAPGKRDFAILLLLASYGLGAAEVLGLHLEDLDWRRSIIRARRPKTKARIELPMLPAVAKALSAYLRWERPPARSVRHLFIRKNMPYEPITSGAIRHRIQHYARLAGISTKPIGAHVFRHSHASRQVDAGANIKVVSDILGHRSSSSTSVYVRVALKRLRTVGLPVPR